MPVQTQSYIQLTAFTEAPSQLCSVLQCRIVEMFSDQRQPNQVSLIYHDVTLGGLKLPPTPKLKIKTI